MSSTMNFMCGVCHNPNYLTYFTIIDWRQVKSENLFAPLTSAAYYITTQCVVNMRQPDDTPLVRLYNTIRQLHFGSCETLIEHVRVFKSLFMAEVNVLYTYDAHQFEAVRICRQMLLSA